MDKTLGICDLGFKPDKWSWQNVKCEAAQPFAYKYKAYEFIKNAVQRNFSFCVTILLFKDVDSTKYYNCPN